MSNHFKPKRVKSDTGPLRVILFRSRKKDNREISGFQERIESFLSRGDELSPEIQNRFAYFVQNGRLGEVSRMYISVNARNNHKTMESLTKSLIDSVFDWNPELGEIDMASVGQLVVSRAALPENADEHRWLLDIDDNDSRFVGEVVGKLNEIDPSIKPELRDTPNGYHVICAHGFDIRKLGNLMDKICLKRDALYLADIQTNKKLPKIKI